MSARGLLLAVLLTPALAGAADRHSTFDMLSPELQAMQRDDAANPGMLGVAEGRALWGEPVGPEGKSCASCHGAVETGMRGIATRYPAFDSIRGQAISLGQRIGLCRANYQQTPAFAPESSPLLALSALIGLQSRGLPIAPAAPELAGTVAEGRQLFTARRGQLNLSCAQCHDDHAGHSLGGARIPQGHPTGYPLYRLEWQGLGSLDRRIRTCLSGVRAAPFAPDSAEMLALATYLRDRAAGLAVETPAVRP